MCSISLTLPVNARSLILTTRSSIQCADSKGDAPMAVLALLSPTLAPQDAETLVRAADIKFKDRDIEGALADYGRAIQVDSRCAPAYYGRGQIRANKGQLPEAEADYTKAVEIDPKFAKAWFGRALLRTYTNNE